MQRSAPTRGDLANTADSVSPDQSRRLLNELAGNGELTQTSALARTPCARTESCALAGSDQIRLANVAGLNGCN